MWITWEQWMNRERERLFCECRGSPGAAGTLDFYRLFEPQLKAVPFEGKKMRFVRDAVSRGIPRECAEQFVKVNFPSKKGRTKSMKKENEQLELGLKEGITINAAVLVCPRCGKEIPGSLLDCEACLKAGPPKKPAVSRRRKAAA